MSTKTNDSEKLCQIIIWPGMKSSSRKPRDVIRWGIYLLHKIAVRIAVAEASPKLSRAATVLVAAHPEEQY